MLAQTPQDSFKLMLITVAGQAFAAAGYELGDHPPQHAAGLFRFSKAFEDGLTGCIEFQLLAYQNTEWRSGMPSRFRVMLTRTDQPHPALRSQHPRFAQRDLSVLVVKDFNVAILAGAPHWWPFENTDSLGKALAEAGHLAIGFGMPWLDGSLVPSEFPK